MSIFFKKESRRGFYIPDVGNFYYNKQDDCWIGNVDCIDLQGSFDLAIKTINENEPTFEQVLETQKFVSNYNLLILLLWKYFEIAFNNDVASVNCESIKQMYFLSRAELLSNNIEWRVTLEPNFNVPTIYNFLPRFTIINNEIVWSNCSIKNVTAQ